MGRGVTQVAQLHQEVILLGLDTYLACRHIRQLALHAGLTTAQLFDSGHHLLRVVVPISCREVEVVEVELHLDDGGGRQEQELTRSGIIELFTRRSPWHPRWSPGCAWEPLSGASWLSVN